MKTAVYMVFEKGYSLKMIGMFPTEEQAVTMTEKDSLYRWWDMVEVGPNGSNALNLDLGE